MNEEERLRAMWQAKLRGDTAEFNRLYREEMEARAPQRETTRPTGRMKHMGDLVQGADGIYRPTGKEKP
ncbi:MAG: hypothetical protein F4Y04_05385 [Chloroflexi bacterium]|nr:hypothetical protein [Chloroflexota bacterium]